jgi:predicted amidophosphoribosyltransferase
MDSEFDPRGNAIVRWAIVQDPLRIAFYAQTAVYRQVRLWLLTHGARPRPAAFDDQLDPTRWTHCLEISHVPDGLDEFLALLHRVIVLQNLPSTIDAGVALDFYTIPDDHVPSTSWLRTEVGELVHTMKYGQADLVGREAALMALVDRMLPILERVPAFDQAILVSVPGHEASRVSWSERLADRVGRESGRRVVRTRARSLLRTPAKEGGVDLSGEFAIEPADVANAAVVIIDDVMRSGSTLKAIGVAARRAGAPDVHALVAARTIR